ncbi:MAG: phage virion morphogenesis protein [Bacteroidales bacterium]|nr:phage virion morphogenesis protein [Bacteroidales bacterium]
MAKDFKHFSDDMDEMRDKFLKAQNDRIPRAIGENLVEGFRESFDLQRFNDYGTQRWREVQRRIPGSGWYGFQYNKNKKTYHSDRATTRNILIGHGRSHLRDSLYLKTFNKNAITIATNKEGAKLHNEGGKMLVFGKHATSMPQRKFMGKSQKLDEENYQILTNIINDIFR